jgi:hypothetical protein
MEGRRHEDTGSQEQERRRVEIEEEWIGGVDEACSGEAVGADDLKSDVHRPPTRSSVAKVGRVLLGNSSRVADAKDGMRDGQVVGLDALRRVHVGVAHVDDLASKRLDAGPRRHGRARCFLPIRARMQSASDAISVQSACNQRTCQSVPAASEPTVHVSLLEPAGVFTP